MNFVIIYDLYINIALALKANVAIQILGWAAFDKS